MGSDGETHQGIFDLSYLSAIPNMTVMAPKNKWELADMLRFAVRMESPAALRYPRGEASENFREFRSPVEYGKSERIYEEEDIAVIGVGHMMDTAAEVRRLLKNTGYNCSLVNARFVKPLDGGMLRELAKDHQLILTVEENVKTGGYGEQVEAFVEDQNLPVHVLTAALPDDYIEHGSVDILREEVLLDAPSITARTVTAWLMINADTKKGQKE